MMHIIIYTEEIWADLVHPDIKPGMYEISNYGHIRNKKRQKLLSTKLHKGDVYIGVTFQTGRKGKRSEREVRLDIHPLVAETFIPIPQKYINAGLTRKDLVPDHLNGDKTNNFAGNLEWITRKENSERAVENGLHWQYVGEKHPNSVYSNEYVIFISDLCDKGYDSSYIHDEVIKKYPQFTSGRTRKNIIQFIGRIRRHDRYGKILDNKHSSTTIERNID